MVYIFILSYSIYFSGADTKCRVNAIEPPSELNITGGGVTVSRNPVTGKYDITIPGSSGGTITGAANVGTGTGNVFRDASAGALNFKTLKAGSNITITDNVDDITIAGTVSASSVTNVGTGTGTIYKDTTSNTINLKSISAGSNVTITNNANDINIASSTPSATTSSAGTVTLATPSSDTTAGHVVQASDTRLSDSRTPTAHASTHSSGGSDPVTLSNLAGSVTVGQLPGTVVFTSDSRLSDARTPLAHKTTHQSGGSDAIALDTLAATTDITTLNASTSAHGLLPKLDGVSTHFLSGLGTWLAPSGSGGTNTPLAKGTITKSGDASNKVFFWPHGMSTLPVYADVRYQSVDAIGSYVVTFDATNITITYQIAPPSGTNNLSFEWFAMDVNGGGGNTPVGEANTYSTVGTGAAWTLTKSGVDLPFRSFIVTNKLTLTTNTNDLTLDVNQANLSIAYSQLTSVPSTIVQTNQSNTYGAFAQTFPTNQFILRNPANTFSSTVNSGAITTNTTYTLPVVSGNDTVTTSTNTATQSNKTYPVDLNTFNHSTTNAAGDLWKSDGTKMNRFPRGTNNQVLTSTGTDLAWSTFNAENTGKATGTANGSTTVFNIAHSIGAIPSVAFVECASHTNTFTYTTDATNIVVTFTTAPAASPATIVFYWRAVA